MSIEAMTRLQSLDRFVVRQRITMMVNRYEIRSSADGEVFALAQQKRMTLKEQVTFYADENRSVPVFGFKARNVLDVHGVTDVFDEQGNLIGTFSKAFGASLLRSTWYVDQPGRPRLTGAERSMPIALLRRFTEIDFLPYHFDFVGPDGGEPAMSVERKWAVRDTYDVTVRDPGLDRRLAAAMAVALDALQSR
jgi:uncharacterized protein YxjI